MKKVVALIVIVSFSQIKALTTVANATGYQLKIEIKYAEQCMTTEDSSFNENESKYLTMLPINAKLDISGSTQQKRVKPWCYKDISSIKAIITVHDDTKNIDTEVGRTWYSDQISKHQNWVIRYTPQQLLILQPQQQ